MIILSADGCISEVKLCFAAHFALKSENFSAHLFVGRSIFRELDSKLDLRQLTVDHRKIIKLLTKLNAGRTASI